MADTKLNLGVLAILITLTAIYITYEAEDLRMRIDKDQSTFYVIENNRWVVSGREVNNLFKGTTLVKRVLSKTNVTYDFDNWTNKATISRRTQYQNGAVIIDTYIFDGNITGRENFPVSHLVEVINASGLIYQYQVRDLVYDGETTKDVQSPLIFGRGMRVKFQEGWYWNTLYATGILKVRYKITSDYETFYQRLYDPVVITGDCDSTCYIVTPHYNATLVEGVIETLWWPNVTSEKITRNRSVSTAGSNIGDIYAGAWRFTSTDSSTECTASDMTTHYYVYCSNAYAVQEWTFHEAYIQVDTTGTSANYRIYNYIIDNRKTPRFSNGTNNVTGTTWQSTNSYTGTSAMWGSSNPGKYFFATAWNESLKTSFDYGNSSTGADTYQANAIGRSSEIAVNQTLRWYIRVMPYNTSASGDNMVLNPLACFKTDPNCGYTATSTAEQYVNTSGLVAYYKLENNAEDSMNLNDGVATSVTYASGVIGQAAVFDGTSSYIQIEDDDIFDLNSAYTFCYWAKRATTDMDRHGILYKYNTTAGERGYYMDINANSSLTILQGNSLGTTYNSSETLQLYNHTNWMFICNSWNKATGYMNISVNATAPSSYRIQGIMTEDISTTTTPIFIGKSGYTSGRELNGSLDEISIWNRSLSPTEIQTIYTNYLNGYDLNYTPLVAGGVATTLAGCGINATFDSANLNGSDISCNLDTHEFNMTLNGEWIWDDSPNPDTLTYTMNFVVNVTPSTLYTFRLPNVTRYEMDWPYLYWNKASSPSELVYSCSESNFTSSGAVWNRTTNYTFSSTTQSYTWYINTGTCTKIWFATVFPYPYFKSVDFIKSINGTYANSTPLGSSTDGRTIYETRISNFSVSESNKRQIYIISRQHPSESHASWALEGMMQFLVNTTNSTARMIRDNTTYYIVHIANPDGVYEGRVRSDTNEQNMNRRWDDLDNDEVKILHDRIKSVNSSVGIEIFIDFHSYAHDEDRSDFLGNSAGEPNNSRFFKNLSKWIGMGIWNYSSSGSSNATAKGWAVNNLKVPVSSTIEFGQHNVSWTVPILLSTGVNMTRAVDEYFYGVRTPYEYTTPISSRSDNLELANGLNVLFVDKNNTNCSDSYSRATALSGDSPFCHLSRAMDVLQGGDTVFVKNGTYFDYADMQNRNIHGTFTIAGYPNERAITWSVCEAAYNATATWTQVATGNNPIWRTACTCDGSSTKYAAYPNYTTMATVSDSADMYDRSLIPREVVWCNTTGTNNVYIKFNQSSTYDPNGQSIIISERQRSMFFQNNNNVSLGTVANMTVRGGRYGVMIDNSSNMVFHNISIVGGVVGMDISSNGNNITRNITLKDSILTGNLDPRSAWDDFYAGGASQTQAIRIQQQDYKEDIYIDNNTINTYFDGAQLGAALGRTKRVHFTRNIVYDNLDDGIEVEGDFLDLYNISNNIFYNSFIGISIAPTNSSRNTSYIYNNIIITNKSILFTRPSTYYYGRCFKIDGGTTANGGIVNLTVLNNLCWMNGTARGAEELGSYATKVVNTTWYNNIYYSTSTSGTSYLRVGGGNTSFNNKRDYEVYKGYAYFYRWNNWSDTTAYLSLALAKASGKDNGQWDNNSLDANPGWDNSITGIWTRFTPNETSILIDSALEFTTRTQEPDVLGNPIYGNRDRGPVEYQPHRDMAVMKFDRTRFGRVYSDGKFRYTNTTASEANVSFSVYPTGGWPTFSTKEPRGVAYEVKITKWQVNKTIWVNTTYKNLTMKVGNQTPSGNYTIYLNSAPYTTATADSTGNITFSYSSVFSIGEATFDIYTSTAGASGMILTINGMAANKNVELGTSVNISASETGETICVDVHHVDYGINFTCQSDAVTFWLDVDYMTKNQTSDFNNSKNLTFTGYQNQTLLISSHQYDDPVGLGFDVRAFDSGGDFPTAVKIYVNDSLSNTAGELSTRIQSFSDDNFSVNAEIYQEDVEIVGYLKLPKSVQITGSSMNISGYRAFDYYTTQTMPDSIATEVDSDGYGVWYLNYSKSYAEYVEYASYPASFRYWVGAPLSAISVQQQIPVTCSEDSVAVKVVSALSSDRTSSRTTYRYYLCDGSWVGGASGVTGGDCTSPTSDSSAWGYLYDANNATTSIYWQGHGVGQCTVASGCGICAAAMFDSQIEMPYGTHSQTGWIEIGYIDGTREFAWESELNPSVSWNLTDFGDAIEDYLANCTADSSGFCHVPIYAYSNGSGGVLLHELDINVTAETATRFTLDEALIDRFLNFSTGFVDVPIKFESTTGGIIEVSNITYSYAGGNKSILVTAHNSNYSSQSTLNLTYYYSEWSYHLPNKVQYIEFMPKTRTSQNVTPYGQTATRPILNVTSRNYGGIANYSIGQESLACVNVTYSLQYNKSNGSLISSGYSMFSNQTSYGTNMQIYLWADYGCSTGSGWYLLSPDLQIKGCCSSCICD